MSLLNLFSALCFCCAMLSKGLTLHLSGWRKGVAGALVITYSIDNCESNDLSRTWLQPCQAPHPEEAGGRTRQSLVTDALEGVRERGG